MNALNGLIPDREEALSLREKGYSVTAVAKMLNRSRDFVQKAEKASKSGQLSYQKRGPKGKKAVNDAGGDNGLDSQHLLGSIDGWQEDKIMSGGYYLVESEIH
jgi:hypothetical protein